MEKNEYRAKIDKIDEEIVRLFSERMDVARQIAAIKKENGLPVFDPKREREKLISVRSLAPDRYADYAERLYSLMMELRRNSSAWEPI